MFLHEDLSFFLCLLAVVVITAGSLDVKIQVVELGRPDETEMASQFSSLFLLGSQRYILSTY
jgi:hypothetical protein